MDLPAPLAPAARIPSAPALPRWRGVLVRMLGVAIALLLVYAGWRGYQNPDLLLDLANFRLC
jgi:hypothetical protein